MSVATLLRRRVDVVEPAERSAWSLRRAARVAYVLGVASLLVSLLGGMPSSRSSWVYTTLTLGTAALWLGNVTLLLTVWRRTFALLFFHVSLVFFVLARPVLWFLNVRIPISGWEAAGTYPALWCVAFSLVGLGAGGWWAARGVGEHHLRRLDPAVASDAGRAGRSRWARRVQLALAALTMLALLTEALAGFEALLYARSHGYYAYYASFRSVLPWPVVMFSRTSTVWVCCYLAAYPLSRLWRPMLGLMVVVAVPLFMLGMRTPLIGAIAFVILYGLVRRNLAGHRGLRVPLGALLAVVLALPVGTFGLGVVERTRTGGGVGSVAGTTMSFLYQQSVTFAVVATGITREDELPGDGGRVYSLGALVDVVKYGPLTGPLGVAPLGAYTQRRAEEGSEFSHTFSYLVYGSKYLRGMGSGSSYLVETYLDGGLVLVLLFSLLLGWLLVWLARPHDRPWFLGVLSLMVLAEIITLPRDPVLSPVVAMLQPTTWLVILGFAAARLLARRGDAGPGADVE